MNPAEVKWSSCIDFDKNDNKDDTKFRIGDHVRISKYKNIFWKVLPPNLSEEFFCHYKS